MAKKEISWILRAKDNVSTVLSRVKNSFKSAISKVGGLLGSFGAALSVAALVGFTKKTIDTADAIAKMSRNLGLSSEEFQKLSFAAKRGGADQDAMVNSMRKMVSMIEDAKDGLSTSVIAFDKLGISMDEMNGKSTFEQFKIIADALSQVEDKSQRAAIAQDFFGRGGVKMIEVAGSYKALGQELENMGSIMTDDNLKAAEDFKDSIENLTTSIQSGLINSGLIKWLADVAEGMNGISKNQPKINDASGGYNKPGMFRNIVDAFIPDKSGTAFTMDVTPEEQAKLDADKKRRQGSGKTFSEEKKATEVNRKAKSEALIQEREQLKEIDDLMKQYDNALAANAKKEEQATQSVRDKIDSLTEELKIQELINQGKLREADIQRALNDAAKTAGRDLTDAEKSKIEKAQGALFDATDKTKDIKTVEPEKIAMERIGAVYGQQSPGKDQTKELKNIASLTKKTNGILEKIADKDTDAKLGSV